MSSQMPLEVEGILVPSQWDQNNRVIGISINTNTEQEYVVVLDLGKEELKRWIRRKVKLIGELQESMGEKPKFVVRDYQLLGW